MRDWLTIELVLGVLLVTSFTCVGLIALWAATSRRHWFIRAALLMAVLAIPLSVPAYEPLLLFSMEACVIVAGVRLWRRRKRRFNAQTVASVAGRKEIPPPGRLQFSLATLLLVTVLLAIGIAPAARAAAYFSRITYAASLSMFVDGAAAGVAILLAAWTLVSPRKRIAWPVAVVLLILLAAGVASLDWVFLSISLSNAWEFFWPPDISYFQQIRSSLSNPSVLFVGVVIFWMVVLAVLALVAFSLDSVAQVAWPSPTLGHSSSRLARSRSTIRRSAQFVAISCLLLLAALPLATLWQVLHPLPVPTVKPPQPNGLDDIVAAGEAFRASPMLNLFQRVEPTSTDELAAEIAKYSEAFDQLQRGLDQEIQVVIFPPDGDLQFANERSHRQLDAALIASFGLAREAELAQRQGRIGDSAQIALQNMRMGQAIAGGGLYEKILGEYVMEGIAANKLYAVSSNLSASECRETIAALTEIDCQRESLEDAEFRDRIRSENVFGWTGKFITFLTDVAHASAGIPELATRRHRQTQAVNRLLTLELAARAYQLENGELPERLEQLSPQLLEQVPVDPFDPAGGPLRYVRSADGYVLYSVGADGDDDGGRPPARDSTGFRDAFGDGDLRLDVFFAPEPTPAAGNAIGAAAADDSAETSKPAESIGSDATNKLNGTDEPEK